MSCGGFRTPGMRACGCGESGGSCSCGSKKVPTSSGRAKWMPPGFTWAGAGVPVYSGPTGGWTVPGMRTAAPAQSAQFVHPTHVIPPGMLGGTAGLQTTGGERRQSSVSGGVAAHARGDMHTHTAQITSSGRMHQASRQESGLGTSHAVFREGHTLERTGSGVPLERHGSMTERAAHPGRGSQAHGDRRTSVPMGINRSSPAALPQERGGQFGSCHDWIQIPGTNIWFCKRTQEWINWDTGKRGYGVGTIDSGNSRSESPRDKSCRVQLWQHDIVRSWFPAGLLCHLWIEVHHCDGAVDRWEVQPDHNDPALGHIGLNLQGPGRSAIGTNPRLVGEAVLACTPSDPLKCRCFSRELMSRYRYRYSYFLLGHNSNTFAVKLLNECGFTDLADSAPFCALGGHIVDSRFAPDPPSVLPAIWMHPRSRLYPAGPR